MSTKKSSQSLLKKLARQRQTTLQVSAWPEQYINKETGKVYAPHNEQEARFVYDDTPTNFLLRGGEGGGKTVAGCIKVLNRLRRGMNGVMVSPDLPHFRRSLWDEFSRWLPWQCVIESQQRRVLPGWEPSGMFTMVLQNEVGGYSELMCGGATEIDIGAWEGPNLSFVYIDEARRYKTPNPVKVFSGRVRILGPKKEPPQLFITTTPRKHWLFDMFGPMANNDPYANFKANSFVATLLTSENTANLSPGFVETRRQSLTEAEARVLLEASWEEIDDVDKFVNLIWWHACQEQLPPLRRDEPLVLAMDAAKGGEGASLPDTFAVVGVTRHPHRHQDVAVRYCGIWQPSPGQLLDYEPIEQEVVRLCQQFSVIEVAYDPYQLHDMGTRLKKHGVANFKEFSQQKDRLLADKLLQQLIASRRISHDGNPLLTQHIDNADCKKSGEDGIRIVKRSQSLKVDAAVALSMATARCIYFNI